MNFTAYIYQNKSMKYFFIISLIAFSFGVSAQTEFTLQTEDNTPVMTSVVDSLAIDTTKANVNKNDIFLELLGVAGVYSLNYQRKLVELNKFSIKGRVGGSFLNFPDLGNDYTLFLGGVVNYQFSKKSSIMLGVGQAYYSYMVYDFFEPNDLKRNTEYYTYFDLSYRLSFNEKWFMRYSYTPVILYYEPEADGAVLENWGGISVGYSF